MCVSAVLGTSRTLFVWSSRCIKDSGWADTNDSGNGLLTPPKWGVGAEVKDGAHWVRTSPPFF